MSEALSVQLRSARGKREVRRLRHGGSIPAVLYGHGQETVCLSAAADDVGAVIRHGTRVVDLQGAVSEKAFIRELQWDVYGTHVVHFDLARVSADEKVRVEVVVELRGEAPGVKEGGVVSQFVHHVEIETLVTDIPDKLTLSVNGLKLGDSIVASAIVLPAGARLLSDKDAVVVQCVLPKEEEEAEAPLGEGMEPEVIGRKAEEETEES